MLPLWQGQVSDWPVLNLTKRWWFRWMWTVCSLSRWSVCDFSALCLQTVSQAPQHFILSDKWHANHLWWLLCLRLSAWSFPSTQACPGQYIHRGLQRWMLSSNRCQPGIPFHFLVGSSLNLWGWWQVWSDSETVTFLRQSKVWLLQHPLSNRRLRTYPYIAWHCYTYIWVSLLKTGQNCDIEGQNSECEFFYAIIWKWKLDISCVHKYKT